MSEKCSKCEGRGAYNYLGEPRACEECLGGQGEEINEWKGELVRHHEYADAMNGPLEELASLIPGEDKARDDDDVVRWAIGEIERLQTILETLRLAGDKMVKAFPNEVSGGEFDIPYVVREELQQAVEAAKGE